MERHINITFVILMTSAYVTCLPSFVFEGDNEATALVHQEPSPTMTGRTKREADHISPTKLLPAALQFRFNLDNRPIRLRLKRALGPGTEQLPVFTLRHGARLLRQMETAETSGFYQDTDHGAALMITQNPTNLSEMFKLEGSLFINGSEYSMSPAKRFWSGGTNNMHNNNSNTGHGNDSTISGNSLYDTHSRGWPQPLPHVFRRLNNDRINYGIDWVDERDPSVVRRARRREQKRRLKRLSRHQDPSSLTNGRIRWRRQSDDVIERHFIEVSMIADYAVWRRFVEYAEGDEDLAFKELQQYYTLIAVMMDVRYQSVTRIDSTLDIRIHPVSLVVTDVREEAIWTERNRIGRSYVDAISSLYTLRNWVRNRIGVPEADHTMLFTGYDIAGSSGRDASTIGVAFIGTACTDNSVSLIEEYFTGTSGAVSAHELGHSLDADHDGTYRQCSDYSSNVMSTQAVFPTEQKLVSNPWIFSSCSVDAFGAFLETSSCTRNEPKAYESRVKGWSFSADEQCRLANGPESYFCRSVQSRRGFNAMCRQLYCYLPKQPGYCGSIIAGEFTACGNKKWCSQGQCVADNDAPSVPDDCPQGDEPGAACQNDLDCEDPKIKDILCCNTCNYNETNTVTQMPSNDQQGRVSTRKTTTAFGLKTSAGVGFTSSSSLPTYSASPLYSIPTSTTTFVSMDGSTPPPSSSPSSPPSPLTSMMTQSATISGNPEVDTQSTTITTSKDGRSSSRLAFFTTTASPITSPSPPRESIRTEPPLSPTSTDSSKETSGKQEPAIDVDIPTRPPTSSSMQPTSLTITLPLMSTITILSTSTSSSSAAAKSSATPPSPSSLQSSRLATQHSSTPFTSLSTTSESPPLTTRPIKPTSEILTTPFQLSQTTLVRTPMQSSSKSPTTPTTTTPSSTPTTTTPSSTPTTTTPSSTPTTTTPSSTTTTTPSSTTTTTTPSSTPTTTTPSSTTTTTTPSSTTTTLLSTTTTNTTPSPTTKTTTTPSPTTTTTPSPTTTTNTTPSPTTKTTTTPSPTTTTPSPTTTTPTTAPPPPAPFIPCNSITCLCRRCFRCFYNVCHLFLPGGLYYNPDG